VHRRRGEPLIAKGKSTSFSSTIDLLVDKMEAQLRRLKDKRQDHNSRGPARRRSDRKAATPPQQ
jgi:ribosome-associated translation inhibitor RaiA